MLKRQRITGSASRSRPVGIRDRRPDRNWRDSPQVKHLFTCDGDETILRTVYGQFECITRMVHTADGRIRFELVKPPSHINCRCEP